MGMIEKRQLRQQVFYCRCNHLNIGQHYFHFGVCCLLQSTKMNIAKAADLVTSSIETLQEFRSDEEWDKPHKYVTDVAKLHDSN